METPKFLRTIRTNKAPVVLDASYGMKAEPYNTIDPNIIRKRAEMIKSNEKFALDICNILRENAEEKNDTSSQEDLEPEETLYSGGFNRLNKDQYLFLLVRNKSFFSFLENSDLYQNHLLELP